MVTRHDHIRFRSRDGLTLYGRSYGAPENDRTLMCLPGLTRNCKDFESTAKRLTPGWRVLTPDFRGRGLSEWDSKPDRYVLSQYVEDAWVLLDHLGIGTVVVLGTSLGGLVGMLMAADQPERLSGLVLNDIGPEIPLAAAKRISRYVRKKGPVSTWADAVRQDRLQYESSFANVPDEFWEDFTRLSWRENEQGLPVPNVDPAVVATLRRSYLRDRVIQRIRKLMFLPTRALPFDAWGAFAGCRVPTLLIRGALSDVTEESLVQRMLRARPDMRVIDVPDRGHAPTLDENESIAALYQYLESL